MDAGVSVQVTEVIYLTEGEIEEVCVAVNSTQLRERPVPLNLSIILDSLTSGKHFVVIDCHA